jgi:hypothetical protein
MCYFIVSCNDLQMTDIFEEYNLKPPASDIKNKFIKQFCNYFMQSTNNL